MTRRNERGSRDKQKVEASGRTVDDAIAAASTMLRVPEDELEIEVVEVGRGGFLGIGSKEATVRAAVKRRRSRGRDESRGRRRDNDSPDRGSRGERGGRSERPPRQERGSEPGSEGRPDRDERPDHSEKPPRSRRDRNERSDSSSDRARGRDDESMAVNVVGRGESELRSERTSGRDDGGDRGERGGRGGRGGSENRGRDSRSRTSGDGGRSERRPSSRRGPDRPPAEYDKALEESIRLFITGLLERMGFPCEVAASFSDGAYVMQVNAGDDDSLLIGRKGETLDALQHVAYKMASRGRDESATVKIDISGYRERRENELADEAKAMAMEVKMSGEKAQTEPLRAAERRIVHRAVTDIEGVTSRAIGTGLVKKIVIQVEREGEVESHEDDSGGRRRSSSSRPPRASAPQSSSRPSGSRPSAPKAEPVVSGEILDYVTAPAGADRPVAVSETGEPQEPSGFGRRARPSKKRRR